ncbi:hypothetical protein F4809DRAFT_270551 [Biscogniauxia mediterranea]|nr:hypothetical protein F5X96DRAFT_674743 [Biscogniauxia mediterranea]KAI1638131.1 hypothetical protein F4809DRAFT_270551 [Biscogniauxia mediterranea]
MADEQVSLTSLLLIVVLGGLIIRYLFFPGAAAPAGGARASRDAQSAARAREAAVERIQQMFPQVDRRTILWDLQHTGGNIMATTERILAGRLATPPVTFQPPPPPPSPASSASAPSQTASKAPSKPAEPDLITRYNLQSKISSSSGNSGSSKDEAPTAKGKAWSSNREERQAALQRRRDDMILAARRKMEAKLAAEKMAGGSA